MRVRQPRIMIAGIMRSGGKVVGEGDEDYVGEDLHERETANGNEISAHAQLLVETREWTVEEQARTLSRLLKRKKKNFEISKNIYIKSKEKRNTKFSSSTSAFC